MNITPLRWRRNRDYKGDTYYTDEGCHYDIMQAADCDGDTRWYVYRSDGSPVITVEQYLADAKYFAETDHATRTGKERT
jgi:hypothetical protein